MTVLLLTLSNLYCPLGLLKVFFENENLTEQFMTMPSNAESIATMLKKLLLTNKELVQFATAHCLVLLLQRGDPRGCYAQLLLNADVAGKCGRYNKISYNKPTLT